MNVYHHVTWSLIQKSGKTVIKQSYGEWLKK